jgi:hypothetical protein
MYVVRAAIAAVVIAIGTLLGFGATAAHATHLPIEYSSDGVHWQTAPLASVYPDGFVIAPGDSQSSTVYLRSTDPDPVALTLAVRDVTTNNAHFAGGLSLSSTSNVSAGMSARTFDDIPDCTHVSPREVVTTGQVVALTLTTTLSDALSARDATGSLASFVLVVGMSDPAVGVGVAGCPSNGGIIPATPADPDDPDDTQGTGGSGGAGAPGVVALTGSDLLYPSLVVAGAALGVGWILVMVGKRRRRPQPTPSKA